MIPIFAKILQLIDITSTSNITVEVINKNEKLLHVCNKLYSISKNDSDVNNSLSNILYKNLHENNLYNFIAEVLFYTVLEKKQPIYINENLNNIIEKKIYDKYKLDNLKPEYVSNFTSELMGECIYKQYNLKRRNYEL